LEDLVLYIAKGYRPLFSIENPWLKHLILHQCGHVRFPIQHQLVNEVLLSVVETTREKYVLLTLASCITCITSFDLWMSCVRHDIFAMVVSFLNDSWEPNHVTMGIFDIQNTACATMANQVKVLLNSFGLFNKVIIYVKDEGSNLNTLTNALTNVVYYSPLPLACPFIGSCFGHAMFKVAQCAINDTKLCVGFFEVSLKGVQAHYKKL
jgi:hypothetical protein